MCDRKKEYMNAFHHPECSGMVSTSLNGDIEVKGAVQSGASDAKIVYWAAAPANFIQSYTGSGLPFPNPELAYENTPNKGIIRAVSGEFTIKLFMPNSFYIDLGTTYVPPHVNIEICDGTIKKSFAVQIGEGIPYRTLTYPTLKSVSRSDPLFYQKVRKPEFRSQEEILRESAFPEENKYAPDYWGGKPSY
jgi:hypothetical protein